MVGFNTRSHATVDRVVDTARTAGYHVTRSQSKGRLSINISRDPRQYEYIAYFRHNPVSGFYKWTFAQHIVDGQHIRIWTLRSFLAKLSSAKTSAKVNA